MAYAKAAEQPANDVACRIVGLDETQHVVALFRESEQSMGDRADAGTRRNAVVTSLQLREQSTRAAARSDSRCACRKTRRARRAESGSSARDRRIRI